MSAVSNPYIFNITDNYNCSATIKSKIYDPGYTTQNPNYTYETNKFYYINNISEISTSDIIKIEFYHPDKPHNFISISYLENTSIIDYTSKPGEDTKALYGNVLIPQKLKTNDGLSCYFFKIYLNNVSQNDINKISIEILAGDLGLQVPYIEENYFVGLYNGDDGIRLTINSK